MIRWPFSTVNDPKCKQKRSGTAEYGAYATNLACATALEKSGLATVQSMGDTADFILYRWARPSCAYVRCKRMAANGHKFIAGLRVIKLGYFVGDLPNLGTNYGN